LIAYVGKTHEQAFERFAHSQMYNHLISLAKSTLKGQSGLNYAGINLVGAPGEVIEKAQRFAEAGVKHFCGTYFCADSVSELMDQMQEFSEEIMPHLMDRV
jgi:alkanesulfonate monooxygenase SsuD/methylene tetrahydromethanopterin reductase-like flavin-dependent oxidoreductase (luciferase family)